MSIRNIARNILPPSSKDLIAAYKHHALTDRLISLPISKSGVSKEGIPFVKLENGLIFYGYPPTKLQRSVYRYFLGHKVKTFLSEETFAVAIDILLRYIGPEAESDYIKSGKYYGFQEGDTVVECGAYLGYYAIRVAEIVKASGKIIAIEPVEQNLKLLSMNVEKNDFKNIVIISKAIWKEKTVQPLFREVKQRASLVDNIVKSSKTVHVECDTIDNILKDVGVNKVNFIRIQVNGAELEALMGMSETIKQYPKLLIAAPYERDRKPIYEEITSILQGAGYFIRKEGESIYAWKV